MKKTLLALCATLFPLLASSSIAFACGGDAPDDAPCVTRVESGWSFDSSIHQDQTRVQVTTRRWVWNEDAGAWEQQEVVEDQTSGNRDEQDDYSQWQTTFSGADWNWGWGD